MEPSEEIRRVVERWTLAISERDVDAALGRLSDNPGALIIGTDAAEWWHGHEAHAVMRRQLEELGALPATWEVIEKIEAWEEGTVGWASLHSRVTMGETSFDTRVTCVLHLERGEWRVVQVHQSLPKPNIEALGRELTVSLEEFEKAVQRDQPDLSSTLAADGTVTIAFTDIVDSTALLHGSVTTPGARCFGGTTP